MKKIALITGATSGIGYELAKVFAKNKINLVIVASNKAKLEEVSQELQNVYGIIVHSIVKDLSRMESASEIYTQMKSENIEIDYLVNDAGFGDYNEFYKSDIGKIEQMLHVNIITLTMLTRLFVDDMITRGSGKILNLGSIASFMPGPMMAVYYATKAYVLNFSMAIAKELKGTGVTVTTLCPGLTSTGFEATANQYESKEVKKSKQAMPDEVADYGYKSMMKGKLIAIHGTKNKVQTFITKIMPRKATLNKVAKKQARED